MDFKVAFIFIAVLKASSVLFIINWKLSPRYISQNFGLLPISSNSFFNGLSHILGSVFFESVISPVITAIIDGLFALIKISRFTVINKNITHLRDNLKYHALT